MGEAKRKAAFPAMISILIPERGRPEMLDQLIRSLIKTRDQDQRYEILVAIDDDDPAWPECDMLKRQIEFELLGARLYRWERPITLGEKLNKLTRVATGSIFWFIANDYVMETSGWPTKFRAAAAALPNGIGIVFPHDDLHPDHAAFPILTRRMMEAVGFLFPPFFGIGWFIDTWHDELGLLLDLHREIDVTVRAQTVGHSKTHGMIDLPFWVEFFEATRALRLRDAAGLAAAAYGRGSRKHAAVMRALPARAALCKQRTRHLSDPAFLAYWGSNAASPPGRRYSEVKSYAERQLTEIRRTSRGLPRWRSDTAHRRQN